MSESVSKVVLAYSGGLDTSVILQWLKDTYECEVVTFTADLGQGGEVEPARQKALDMGQPADSIYIEDVREEFVRDFVYPMFRANTIYEGEVPPGDLHRSPAHCQTSGRDRPGDRGPTPSPTVPLARATIRFASNSGPTPSSRESKSLRRGASGIS